MIPKPETPLERVERQLAELKVLLDIVVPVVRTKDMFHLGPWDGVHEHSKYLLLDTLDWTGVAFADKQRIVAREVKPYDFWDCFTDDCRKW